VLCSGIVCWWCGIRVQPALGYHITNRQSRYTTPTRLKSAQYSLHNNAPSSRKLLKMDILTSETCWAVDNKASVIKLVNLYSNIKMMHGPILIRCLLLSYKTPGPGFPFVYPFTVGCTAAWGLGQKWWTWRSRGCLREREKCTTPPACGYNQYSLSADTIITASVCGYNLCTVFLCIKGAQRPSVDKRHSPYICKENTDFSIKESWRMPAAGKVQ